MSELTIKLEVTGLDGLVQSLNALLAKAEGAGSTNSVMQTNTIPTQQTAGYVPTMPVQPPVNAQPPVQNGFPVQNTVPTQPMQGNSTLPTGVPTTAMAQEFTQDQLSVAAAGLVNQGKQARLLELLHGFGVNAIVELPKERYGEFATALRAEGAVI